MANDIRGLGRRGIASVPDNGKDADNSRTTATTDRQSVDARLAALPLAHTPAPARPAPSAPTRAALPQNEQIVAQARSAFRAASLESLVVPLALLTQRVAARPGPLHDIAVAAENLLLRRTAGAAGHAHGSAGLAAGDEDRLYELFEKCVAADDGSREASDLLEMLIGMMPPPRQKYPTD